MDEHINRFQRPKFTQDPLYNSKTPYGKDSALERAKTRSSQQQGKFLFRSSRTMPEDEDGQKKHQNEDVFYGYR